MPSPMLFTMLAEVVKAYPIWLGEEWGRGIVALRQSIFIDPWTLRSPYSSLSHTQGGGSTLPKRPLTRFVWIT